MGCGGAGGPHPGAHRAVQDESGPGGPQARENPELGCPAPRSPGSSAARSLKPCQVRTAFKLGRIPGACTVGARQCGSRGGARPPAQPGACVHERPCRLFRSLQVGFRHHPRADGSRPGSFHESPAHAKRRERSHLPPGGSRGQVAFGSLGRCGHSAETQALCRSRSLPGPQGSGLRPCGSFGGLGADRRPRGRGQEEP